METYYVIQAPAHESTEACLKKKQKQQRTSIRKFNHIICAWQWLRLDILKLKACDFGGPKKLVLFLVEMSTMLESCENMHSCENLG